MLELIVFYTFAAVAVVSAILVITRQNAVHSAMFLAATLLSVAGVFLSLNAEFLAGVQVIVYVGGILVLFVFVIMLVPTDRAVFERRYNRAGESRTGRSGRPDRRVGVWLLQRGRFRVCRPRRRGCRGRQQPVGGHGSVSELLITF